MRRRGYTLRELTATLAILLVLVAVLAPHYQRERARAAQLTCAQQLHQVGRALTAYINDYDLYLPAGGRLYVADRPGAIYGERLHRWVDVLAPYDRMPRSLVCPAQGGGRRMFNSYGWCEVNFGADFWGPGSPGIIHENRVENPTEAIIAGDNEDLDARGLANVEWLGAGIPPPTSMPTHGSPIAARHSGGANYLWLDGHVMWTHREVVSQHWELFAVRLDSGQVSAPPAAPASSPGPPRSGPAAAPADPAGPARPTRP